MIADLYLWNLTQDFERYEKLCKVLKTVENKNIGSHCKIFQEKFGSDNTLYIWFKGTEWSIKDILVDIFYYKKKLKNKMKVHAGFWSAIESIYKKIKKYLDFYMDKNYQLIPYTKIVVFGHSLGAAMAKEFIRRLAEYYYINNIEGITWGTPRTGNKYYANYFNKINIREYIHRADIICKLPLRIMNYRHLKKEKIKYVGKWGISIKAHLNY